MTYSFSQTYKLYKFARVVSSLVEDISAKYSTCLNSLKLSCRQLYDSSVQPADARAGEA